MIKYLLKKLACFLIRITPKFSYCYIKAMPSFEDNVVALYKRLPMDRFDKVIWMVYSEEDVSPFEDRGKTIFVKKGSVRDFFYGVISKYVFTTHGHFIPQIPSNQICVNLWHGMPYKGIGILDNQQGRQDTYVCSTSELYQGILSRAFGLTLDKVLITGSPRNDLLQSTAPESIWERAGIDRDRYDKVFFWLPTFRKSVLGHLCENGVECDNVFNMVDFPVEAFNDFLKSKNCLCIIKPHPMAPVKKTESTDHLLMIDEDWLWTRKLTLYPLVGQTDFMVSDISSIMIDYMLLDRPMVVCFEDAEEYKKSRNLIFEPIEDWLPGVMVKNYDDLADNISQCLDGQDPSREKRHKLKKRFHAFEDFSSTKRVLSAVFGDTKR